MRNRALDISKIEQEVPFLRGANIIQREKNTLSAIVDRDGPVKVSFFGLPNLPRLSPPPVAKDNGLAVASLLDLAGTKASVVQMRAEATKGKVDLPLALSAARGRALLIDARRVAIRRRRRETARLVRIRALSGTTLPR